MCGLESSVGTLSTSIVMLGAPPLKDHDRSHENMVAYEMWSLLSREGFRELYSSLQIRFELLLEGRKRVGGDYHKSQTLISSSLVLF